MAFTSETQTHSGKTAEVLYPLHEIDSYNGEEMKTYVSSLEGGVDAVIINFSRVAYLNSSGLRELIQILKLLKGKGMELFLTYVNDDIKKIFDNTNLNRLFGIYNTNEDALEFLGT
ncbi:STAS domain-containing protein [Limisalsivibrio acetivorans]|uniref:STAS domain-containing protein n=1 Tax=Limisalsivibrio acetivorans TaxID=1304888 RepID=UPI0003B6ABB2|nr:STAS domain-containing protein [Limisalsivibrio acetivorans]